MQYQYEFKADYETRKIYFGEWEINHKGYMKRVKDVVKTVKEMNGRLEGSQYDGSLYKNFNTTYGITPTHFKKVYNAIWRELWVTPVEKWALQYAFTSSKKINLSVIQSLHEHKDNLSQMEADNTQHLIPFLIYWSKPPSEMKKIVGKGVWKRVCKNSKTRNLYLAKLPRNILGHNLLIEGLSVPSTVLRRGRCYHGDLKIAGILCKHFKVKDVADSRTREVTDSYRMIDDTIGMARRLGVETNNNWTLRKWQEKHEQFTRDFNARRYSPEPIEWLVALPESLKTVDDGDLTARLLISPLDIRTEGDMMHHCVGSYSDRVVRGEYLVYHVEDDGSGTTIGLVKNNNRWTVQQHYGKCNSYRDVTDDHSALAGHICMMLNSYEQERIA